MISIFDPLGVVKARQRERLTEQYRLLAESECVVTEPAEWDDINTVEIVDIDPEAAR